MNGPWPALLSRKNTFREIWRRAGNLTDQQTITVHLREGITWQKKAPVNGREFTSEDVVFHYDRLLGTGHGYSSPSPFAASMVSNMKNVTVVDKYTVQFHFKTSCGGIAFMTISDPSSVNWFEAPEWVALAGVPTTEATQAGGSEPPGEGPPADGDAGGGGPPGPPPVPTEGSSPLTTWKNVVGTGPWMLTDFVSNSSETWSKNSDYWATDPRYPQNKTPYLDSVKLLYISDVSTKVAALRTGKIDLVGGVDWQHAQTLNDTDFQKASVPIESGSGVTWRNDLAPFSDINVRKALNMAVDRQAISQSLYHGLTDDKPMGLVTQSYTGYCYSYEDWPQSLKDEYTYNPTRPNSFSLMPAILRALKQAVLISAARMT